MVSIDDQQEVLPILEPLKIVKSPYLNKQPSDFNEI